MNAPSLNPDWAKLPIFDRSKWKLVRFGDVVRMLKEQVDPQSGEVDRYIAGEHMESENVHIRKWGTVGDGYLGPAFIRRFRKGQVLYGSRRTYLKKVAMAEFDGVTANTTFVLQADEEKLLQELLPWIMLSERFTEHSIRESKGSTNPYINFPDIAKFEFALPPLDQQRRIAEILRAVDEVGESTYLTREAALVLRRTSHTEVFLKGLRGNGKTGLGQLPDGWRMSTVGEACLIENRLRKPINSTERATMQGDYPYYGPTGILDHLNEFRVEGQYTLIGEDGDHFLKFDTWNMTHLVKGRFNVNNHAHLLRGTESCRTEWIFQYFKHRDITPFLSRQGSGRLKLQKAVLEKIPITVPPLHDQDSILEFLREIDAIYEIFSSRLKTIREMLIALINEFMGSN